MWGKNYKETLMKKGIKRCIEQILWLFAAGFAIAGATSAAYRVGETHGARTIMDCSNPNDLVGPEFRDDE